MAVHIHPRPAPAPPPALPEHDIVVNGTAITPREVAAEMQHHPAATLEAAWQSAAQALVVRRLLLDAAAARGAAAPGTEDDAAVAALLAQEIRVPDPDEAACRRWHAAHPERFGSPEAWDASHILLAADPEDPAERDAARRTATALLAEIAARPGLLPELARQHSACPSGAEGGHLGRIERGSTVPEFEAGLAATAPGQVCASVIESRYGMHVLHLHHHFPARAAAFDQVAGRVARDLREASWQAAARQLVALLAGEARIEGFSLGEGTAGPLVQ
jgi:peptidyl-prolyl cis-trans isomerase C